MQVSVGRPLRSWILGFGAAARVVAPLRLAREIFEQIENTRKQYMPQLTMTRDLTGERRTTAAQPQR